MSNKEQVLEVEKEILMKNLFQHSHDKKLFKTLDQQLTQQRFNNISSLSANENILNLNATNTTLKELEEIINKFLNIKKIPNVFSSRSIYEIVKLSNLSAQKINKNLSVSKILSLCDKLSLVSCETIYISQDFLVLHIVDNFLIKISDTSLRKKLILLKKELCHQLINKKYQPEEKNKPSTCLCWIDTLLNLTINDYLSANKFITVCSKITKLTGYSQDILWKISSSIAFLLQNPLYCDDRNLRNFKRNLQKSALSISSVYTFTQKKISDLVVQTLAKDTINKEDYYYLFNSLKNFAESSSDNKIYSLNLCYYLFYRHKIKNLFSYRHIRENFLKTLFEIITNTNSLETDTLSFLFLCRLLTDQENFELHFNDLFDKALYLLKKISNSYKDITPQKFYKYCNILDYLARKNKISTDNSLSCILSGDYWQAKQIQKHIKYTKFKYSV